MTGSIRENKRMQLTDWPPEHSAALREYLVRGLSFSRIAQAINAKFKTAYSRSATLGRAKRMGLASSGRPDDWPVPAPRARAPRLHWLGERYAPDLMRPMPIFEAAEPVKLRCVEIDPRHLSLFDLEPGDCRYPYGGDADGEAITFCGHPRREGSSYCLPHFHLTRDRGIPPEPTASTVSLRLVEVA
jgi:GcrA cell cycle regulator